MSTTCLQYNLLTSNEQDNDKCDKIPHKIPSVLDVFTKWCLFPPLKHFRRLISTGK